MEGVTTWAGLVARRLERLTLDNLGDLPVGCRRCVFWELDPVRRQRSADAGSVCEEKEAWVSQVLLEWGSCGRVAYVDGDPAGYVLFAPPSHLPGAHAFPTAPVSEAAQAAARSYTEAFKSSQDVLGKMMHDVAGWLGSAKGWLDEQMRRRNDGD